ncbi:glycoside hydrolase family 47 protein [Streptomyces gamaensis]|uniref:Glycoside hydrolase family 47 protein n=1 Tax=Streptomyces gamaensis TaxID=1763542 RepID=A0ABW0Z548_9ACTN
MLNYGLPAAFPSRRGVVTALAAAGGLTLGGGPRATAPAHPDAATGEPAAAAVPAAVPAAFPLPARRTAGPPDRQKAERIRAEFLHAWRGYKAHAWGHDELLPLSRGHREFFASRHPVGLSIVEALDTHYVMGLDDELARSVSWITSRLDFDIDAEFQVFEAVIRLVGGLLAGYLATGDRALLERGADLADRLLPAFLSSPTGMPYRFVNLRTGAVSGTIVPLAEVGTNILEFGVLSELTGDRRYFRVAKRALRAIVERRSALNLLGTTIDVETGLWSDPKDVSVNPPADSFYEYLWGGWEMFHDPDCLRWFRLVDDALKQRVVERVDGRVWFRTVDFRTGVPLDRHQSSLAVAVLPVGGDNALAADYYRSWTAVMDKYGVIPEAIDYTRLDILSRGNELRPEYANCAFELYWQTGDPYYRTTAWRYFQNLTRHHRVPGGYTVVADVTRRPMTLGDRCPAYVFAENFKWLYLTFAAAPRFDYAHGYLSTEGKILRGLRRR